MGEIWKDIKGYEGYYQISSFGRVKSVERIVERKNNTKMKVKERILRQHIMKNGYCTVNIIKKTYKTHLVHRLVAIAFINNEKCLPQVNHIDGNKGNNNLSNLEWCTQKENSIHASKNGLLHSPKGEECHFSKRRKEDIMQIRSLYHSGEYTMKELAIMFKSSSGYICDVVNKKLWKHI